LAAEGSDLVLRNYQWTCHEYYTAFLGAAPGLLLECRKMNQSQPSAKIRVALFENRELEPELAWESQNELFLWADLEKIVLIREMGSVGLYEWRQTPKDRILVAFSIYPDKYPAFGHLGENKNSQASTAPAIRPSASSTIFSTWSEAFTGFGWS